MLWQLWDLFYVQGLGQKELCPFCVEFQRFRPGLTLPSESPATPELRMSSTQTERNRESWWVIQDHRTLNIGPLICSVRKQTGFCCTPWNPVPVIREARPLIQNTVCTWMTLLLIGCSKTFENKEKYCINKTGFQRRDLYCNLCLTVFFGGILLLN